MFVLLNINMQQTNFQKVIEFHSLFGLPYCETVNVDNLQNFKIVSLRFKLIQEEFKELCDAKNITEQLDAIGDLLYVVYGAGASFGFNLDTAFNDYCLQKFSSNLFSSANCNHNNETNFFKTLKLCAVNNIILSTQHPEPSFIQVKLNNQIRKFSHALLMCDTLKVQNILVRMLFTLYSVGYYCNYNINKLFAEIHKSNMSKICNDEDVAIETVQWYLDDERKRYSEPTYDFIPNSDQCVVFDKTTNKRLKSVYYSSPDINPYELQM